MYVKNSFWSKQRSHWQCWQGCFGQCYHKHYRAEHAIDFLVNWWSVWRQSNQCKICEIGVASYLLARMVGGLARGGFINVVTELLYVVSGEGGGGVFSDTGSGVSNGGLYMMKYTFSINKKLCCLVVVAQHLLSQELLQWFGWHRRWWHIVLWCGVGCWEWQDWWSIAPYFTAPY